MEQMDFTKQERNRWKWLLLLLFLLAGPAFAQRSRLVTLDLRNEVLSSALKQIEWAGGKSILFTYKEVNNYRVSARLRKKTEQEAISIVLSGKPFESLERNDYFVIRYTGKSERVALIHGTVRNERNEPMAFANVLLLDAASHAYISGCATGDDGSFVLLSAGERAVVLKVSYIGYESETVAYRETNDIRLQPDAKLLKELKVTSSRPLVERKKGALVANVQGTVLSLMGSASDMVSHLPMVTGSDGDYKVIGRGKPEIYINGRKVRDNEELNRLQANEVLSAEVITSPGVRYASDVAAVIRLKTVRKRGQGLSGSFYTQYTQGRKAWANEGLDLNYRTGGLDVFMKGYFSEQQRYSTDNSVLNMWDKAEWESHSNTTTTGKSARFNGELGFNYEVNDHQSFGFRYAPDKRLTDDLLHDYGTTVLYKNREMADRLSFDSHTTTSFGWGHSMNAYYTGEFGKWNIDFNADYYKNTRLTSQLAANNGETDAVTSDRVKNDLYAAKISGTVALGNSTVSVGTEDSYTNRYDTFKQNGFSADADDHIRQLMLAAFADYSLTVGKWSFAAGLRYEYQRVKYYEAGALQERQSPSYNHILPTASVAYQSGDWNSTLGYKLMKVSPYYVMLGSAVNYVSKYHYQNGNPLLVPQKHHVLTWDAGWKWVNFSANFDYTRQMYTSYFRPYNTETHPGVVLETMASIPNSYTYGATLVLTPKIGCWQINFMTDMAFFESDGSSIGIPYNWKEPQFSFSLDNSFMLPRGWFLNITGKITTKAKRSYGIDKRMGTVSARISRFFLRDKALQVSLIANDLFRTGQYYFSVYGDRTFMNDRFYGDLQRFGLRVSYKFNATKSKYKGTGAGQDERERL